jgi:hypothetical protein
VKVTEAQRRELQANLSKRKERPMARVTEALKGLDMDRMAMDDLIEYSAAAKHLSMERELHGLTNPEWLTDVISKLQKEIRAKSRDELELRKKELLAQASGLESAAEKRARIQRELADLDAKLGNVPTTA